MRTRTITSLAGASVLACAAILWVARWNPAYAVIWVPAGLVCAGVWLAARGTRLRTLVALGCAVAVLAVLGLAAADAAVVPGTAAVPGAPAGASICALTPGMGSCTLYYKLR